MLVVSCERIPTFKELGGERQHGEALTYETFQCITGEIETYKVFPSYASQLFISYYAAIPKNVFTVQKNVYIKSSIWNVNA